MADHFFPCLENLKHSMSLTDIDQVLEYNNTNHLNPNNRHQQQREQPMLSFNQMGSSFPHDQNHFPYFPDFHVNSENLNGFSIHDVDHIHHPVADITTISSDDQSSLVEKKKRKSIENIATENSSAYSSPQASDNGIARKNSSGRGKKVKRNEKGDGELREVVHVRAKRGQATDSHSLAERVRRGKINERLRCLQDIVPGCYKTMGMAVMLDEIINYVQSLQNQVEFLSMKLTAASTVYDFNSDMDAIEAMQKAKALEALKMQNTQSQGYPISAQFDNLGYLPQFPHNR